MGIKNVLYISLTGMTEPLGESQVLQYVLTLSEQFPIYLLSFEKKCGKNQINYIRELLKNKNIFWHYYTYQNRLGMLSAAWQIITAFFFAIKIIRRKKIKIIHARSIIPGTIAMLLKKITRVKFLFDIRGFAIDEKILEGRLKEKSWLTSILKKIEYAVYQSADHIVTLTHASKPLIAHLYQIKYSKITVIPTCANEKIFTIHSEEEKNVVRERLGFTKNNKIILHNGSLNSSVDFNAECLVISQLMAIDGNIYWLILNQGQHDLIKKQLRHHHINENRCYLGSASFHDIASFINAADICLFFIKPSLAKEASAPTKFAELVACHTPVITNIGYGDMNLYLKDYPVGLTLDLKSVYHDLDFIILKIHHYIKSLSSLKLQYTHHFIELFHTHFSNKIAVERYHHLYQNLMDNQHENIITN